MLPKPKTGSQQKAERIRHRILAVLEEIEREIELNDGCYPGGHLGPEEIARRAGSRSVVYQMEEVKDFILRHRVSSAPKKSKRSDGIEEVQILRRQLSLLEANRRVVENSLRASENEILKLKAALSQRDARIKDLITSLNGGGSSFSLEGKPGYWDS